MFAVYVGESQLVFVWTCDVTPQVDPLGGVPPLDPGREDSWVIGDTWRLMYFSQMSTLGEINGL